MIAQKTRGSAAEIEGLEWVWMGLVEFSSFILEAF